MCVRVPNNAGRDSTLLALCFGDHARNKRNVQGHPTTVFCEISVRRAKIAYNLL